MHPRLRAGRKRPVRYGRLGFGGRAPALSPNAGRPGPHRVRCTRPLPSDLRRFTEGLTSRAKQSSLLRQGLPRSALPGSPPGRGEQAQEKSRSDRRQEAGEFAVSTWTYCRQTPEPAREVDGHGCPSTATSRVHFFGYFLCASKESDPAARKADGTQQGRTPRQCDTRPKAKSLGPRLRGDDEENEDQDGFRPSPE